MKIDFDEEKHEYRVGRVKVPSVSEILAPLSAMRYGDLNPAMLQAAANRGTAIHKACEEIDYGLEPDEDPETEPYLDAYRQFLIDHDVQWDMIERIVHWDDEDGVAYCGTLDRYGMLDGKRAVVDIKTYASMTTDAQISASCQTQLYRDCISNWLYIGRFILHLRKDGTYRLIDLDEFDEKRDFESGYVADACYAIYKRVADAKKRRKR